MDDLVVVVDELTEAEHVAVVVDELVHVAQLDVAHAVVDLEQRQAARGAWRLLDLAESGGKDTVIVGAIDERVDHLAVGVHRAAPEAAVLVRPGLGVLEVRAGAAAGRLAPRRSDVVDGEGDVVHAITVAVDAQTLLLDRTRNKISIGDFVLAGGELPAVVIMEAVSRHIPGFVGKQESVARDSHKEDGYLEYPHYTRPEVLEYKGKKYRVPKVLLSGNHKKIEEWRNKQTKL